MTAWLLVNGVGVVDGVGPDDKKGGENNGKEKRDLSHVLLRFMAALALSVACSMTP